MSADSDLGVDGGRFVVPSGMPHLAPVLEPGAGVVMRRCLTRFPRSRDQNNPTAERDLVNEVYACGDDPQELLCGLFTCAETTAREAYGRGARSVLVDNARAWRDCPAADAAGEDPEAVQGYLSATHAVDCLLAGNSDTAYTLIERLLALLASDLGCRGRVRRHRPAGRPRHVGQRS